MRLHVAAAFITLVGLLPQVAGASWYRDCVFAGEARSVRTVATSTEASLSQVTLRFRISEASALKGTYDPTFCTDRIGSNVDITIHDAPFVPMEKAAIRVRYRYYETMCAEGGACASELYELLSEREAAELAASES